MKIGYTLYLRKIGMVVIVPGLHLKVQLFVVKFVISGPGLGLMSQLVAERRRVKLKVEHGV